MGVSVDPGASRAPWWLSISITFALGILAPGPGWGCEQGMLMGCHTPGCSGAPRGQDHSPQAQLPEPKAMAGTFIQKRWKGWPLELERSTNPKTCVRQGNTDAQRTAVWAVTIFLEVFFLG